MKSDRVQASRHYCPICCGLNTADRCICDYTQQAVCETEHQFQRRTTEGRCQKDTTQGIQIRQNGELETGTKQVQRRTDSRRQRKACNIVWLHASRDTEEPITVIHAAYRNSRIKHKTGFQCVCETRRVADYYNNRQACVMVTTVLCGNRVSIHDS
jgi:hypothetical protein